MNDSEIEMNAIGAKILYRRSKSSRILKPCEHFIAERGLRKKRLLTFHGAADGSTTVKLYAL